MGVGHFGVPGVRVQSRAAQHFVSEIGSATVRNHSMVATTVEEPKQRSLNVEGEDLVQVI